MAKLRVAPRVTIFATEVDEAALATARAGRYPEALMEGVSLERRRRFFTADPGGYVVAKESPTTREKVCHTDQKADRHFQPGWIRPVRTERE